MEKKLNKPHEINERTDSPLGLPGVPPDGVPYLGPVAAGATIIVVNGNVSIIKDKGRPKSLPQ